MLEYRNKTTRTSLGKQENLGVNYNQKNSANKSTLATQAG